MSDIIEQLDEAMRQGAGELAEQAKVEIERLRARNAELLITLRAIAFISVNPAVPEAYPAAFRMCQAHARKALDEEEQP